MLIDREKRYYYRASWERLASAKALLHEMPALSLYLSGLSAECMLRAWQPRGEPFLGRHDLPNILRGAPYYGELGHNARRKLAVATKSLTLLWTNSVRYYPNDKLVAELRRRPKYQGTTRGKDGWYGLLRRAAKDALEHATTIVKAGEIR